MVPAQIAPRRGEADRCTLIMNELNLPPTIPSADALPTAIQIATSSASVSREHALTLLHYVAVGRRWEDSARTGWDRAAHYDDSATKGWARAADLTAQLDATAKQRDEAREQRERADATLYARLTAKQAELDDALAELRELDEQHASDARVASCKLAAKQTEAALSHQALAEARAEVDELRGELDRAREQIVEQQASIAAYNANLANYSRVACELVTLRADLRKLGGAQ